MPRAELVEEFGGTWTDADAQAMIGMSLLPAARVLADHGVDLPVEVVAVPTVREADGLALSVGADRADREIRSPPTDVQSVCPHPLGTTPPPAE